METHLSPQAFTMLRDSATKACNLLKVMANEDRLLLLCQLTQGERNVGELETLCGIRQPTLSQQLAVLREEGLVNARREGKYIFYSLASAEVILVMNTMSSLYCGRVLADMKRHGTQ
jgi:DNA-binding transcriptional ArsR family regulator